MNEIVILLGLIFLDLAESNQYQKFLPQSFSDDHFTNEFQRYSESEDSNHRYVVQKVNHDDIPQYSTLDQEETKSKSD